MTAALELRTLRPASGLELETRARCQDDGHPAGCFNPLWPGTFCHCGRVIYAGEQPIEYWPRPPRTITRRAVFIPKDIP